MKRIAILITLLLSLTACSNGIKGVVETPEISVYGVRMGNLSFTEGSMIIALRVKNPNAFSIPLRGLDYGLSVNNIKIATGSVTKNMSITGHEDRIIEIPVIFKPSTLIQAVPNLIREQKLTYDLSGTTQFPFINIPFKRVGRVGAY
jgi:LEA14-like dessication related protein